MIETNNNFQLLLLLYTKKCNINELKAYFNENWIIIKRLYSNIITNYFVYQNE